MSFLSLKHLSNRNEVMTLNLCLLKIKITKYMARAPVFGWSIQQSLDMLSYVMTKQEHCVLKIQGSVREQN